MSQKQTLTAQTCVFLSSSVATQYTRRTQAVAPRPITRSLTPYFFKVGVSLGVVGFEGGETGEELTEFDAPLLQLESENDFFFGESVFDRLEIEEDD